MATEIERKFLVADLSVLSGLKGVAVVQGYLAKESVSVRVRTLDDQAFLTLKGPFVGIARDEYEYPIPVGDAHEMLTRYCQGCIVRKTRFYVPHASHVFEVDVYSGRLRGLVLAEVELAAEHQPVSIPDWLGPEVTGDPRFGNRSLALMDAPPALVPAS